MEEGGIYLSSVCRGVRKLFERQLKVEEKIISSLMPRGVRVAVSKKWIPQRLRACALKLAGLRVEEQTSVGHGWKTTTKTVWVFGRRRGSFRVIYYEGWDRNRIGIKTEVIEKWP